MKRVIKFRGKCTDTGEWVYGDLIHGVGSKHGRMYILPVTHIYPKGCNSLDGWEVGPETVGQFTGLLDKNGKEIYEGDIIKYLDYDDNNLITLRNSVVEYYKGCFVYSLVNGKNQLLGTTDICDFEVIGNAFDNPELLKGGKQ